MPGGGMMQLIAYGAQGIFLAGNDYRYEENIVTWELVNKLLDLNKNSECPITYEDFTTNCKYCMCHQCKYNFSEEGLKTCFKEPEKKCPMCKTKWKNWIVYTNC